MLQKEEIKRLSPLVFFWAAYTVVFFLWVKTFFYTLPLLIGLLIAIAIQPAISFLEKHFRWNHTLSTALVTAAVLLALFAALAFLGVFAIREITAFIVNASEDGFSEFSKPVADFLNRAGEYLQQFNLKFLEQNKQEILDLLQNSMDFISGFLGAVLGVITSLPTAITMLIMVAFSTFFLSRDMGKLRALGKRLLSENAVFHVKSAAENSGGMGRKYLVSYLFLYFITFCETYVILIVLEMPYPLITALITALADILPVLGPGIVFLSLSFYRILTGEYAGALGLLIGWGITSLIRQILEPRLISATVKIHPLAMLAAIYFSLVGKSIWILFYMMGFFALHSAFRETRALPSLLEES